MPEGPEIQRVADKVGRVLLNQELTSVSIPWEPLHHYEQVWNGAVVENIQARGKALLTTFSTGDILYSHNQLYGRWLTRRKDGRPSSTRTLRLALRTDKGAAFLYSATDLEVLERDQLGEHPYLGKLGPDILDPDLKAEDIEERLGSRTFRRRQLGALYLDQAFLAGPGNYLRSEILFCGRVHPRRKPSQLSPEALAELARQTLEISQRAYQCGGVTVPQEMARRLKDEGQRKRQYRHYVFGRQGKVCRLCGKGQVEKTTIASRSVFFCPVCQPS